MAHFDFTPTNGKNCRPSAARIIAAWKCAGRPSHFTVEYGETFAEFRRVLRYADVATWDDSGNGCRGVDRNAVVKALVAATTPDRTSEHYRFIREEIWGDRS